MKQPTNRRDQLGLLLIVLATVVGVYLGWRLFWFLTDDAFIAFRYISNSQLGYGYVWNAPPFRTVEGYTSFLWVVLLDVVWRVSGVEPPAAANYVSLLFTYLTLLVGGQMVLQLQLTESLSKYRLVFLSLVLVGVGTNRTFLAWSSSGLETAMFNFWLTLWLYCCLFVKSEGRRWLFSLSLTTALLCLTRPDGLLFAVVTVGLIGRALWQKKAEGRKQEADGRRKELTPDSRLATPDLLRFAVWATPLLIIPAHVMWRRWVYGAWLPNTYYAKTIAGRIWPQSGLRYLGSFVLEYALWVWLAVLLVVLVSELRRWRGFRELAKKSLTQVVVSLAVVGHVLYYTIVIGGDHFEYRVYSQLVLLIFITFLWLLNTLGLRARSAALLFVLFIVLSWPVPWLHWYATHDLSDRRTTVVMRVAVAKAAQRVFPLTPSFVLNYLRAFDSLQFWLIGHSVCMRHQEHKVFYLHQTEILPTRAEGLSLPVEGYPVLTASSVGVVSWVLPRVNIIDALGLNDYVVARNPDLNLPIEMAHERRPPKGYMECFATNVVLTDGHFTITPRADPLTVERIVRCEQDYAAAIKKPKPPDAVPPTIQNPIDDPRFFVRQQYLDVLDREPDPDGLTYWSDHLLACPTGSYCFNDSRVSMPIVLSDPSEFRETAQFVYRMYAVSFGVVPHFADFMRDRTLLGHYQIDWRDRAELVPAHQSFTQGWVQRDSFRTLYPEAMAADEFVNRLFNNANLKPYLAERESLSKALRAGKSRAEVLAEIVEREEFKRKLDEQSVVPLQLLMQLRRDVQDDKHYQVWLDKLKRSEPVDARHVICLALTSDEYQRRFGPVITHSNAECP
jgi:arabinofuranosyltransferase